MNARKTLIMFGMIALIFSSCSDDDSPSTQNTVTLDDGKFNISTATIVGVAIDGEGHAGISFIEANNTMSKTLNVDVDYAGDSNVAGTYSYPQEQGDRLLLDALTNYTEMSSDGDVYSATLVSGTVSVQVNGNDNYTVTMNLEMEDGKTFAGTYRGKFLVQFSNQ